MSAVQKNISGALAGGVAQWTWHSPEELQTRVRIPRGYKVLRRIIATLLCIIDLICIVCVLKNINKPPPPKKKIIYTYILHIFMVTNVGTIFLTGRKMQQKSPRRCKKIFFDPFQQKIEKK
jgi:hypothetical protein